MKFKFIILVLICFVFNKSNAQNVSGTSGLNGNFIFAGRTLPKGVNKTIISRNNEAIAELSFPNSETEFIARVHDFYSQNSYFPITADSLLINYWQWSTGFSLIDSLPIAAKQVDVLVGLGVVFFDKIENINKQNYNYEVKKREFTENINISNREVSSNCIIKTLKSEANFNQIALEWYFKGDFNIIKVNAYKQHKGQDELQLFQPMIYLFKFNDTTVVKFVDTNCISGLTYRYAITVFDQLGRQNISSDTIEIVNVPLNSLPILMHAKTWSNNTQKAINLNWGLQNLYAVQTIDIFRSLYYDSAYEYLETVQASDTSFTDFGVLPVTAYWYKIVVNGVFERELNTVKITGILKIGAEIIPIKQIDATSNKYGILVSWIKNNNETRGFYVYRAIGYKGIFEQISPLILANDQFDVYQFFDSTNIASEGKIFSYVVKSLSDGYVLSGNSDTASATMSINTNILSINQISGYIEGKTILLVWASLIEDYPSLAGYYVARLENEKWIDLDTISANLNQYLDSKIELGKKYSYKITPFDISENLLTETLYNIETEAPTIYSPQIIFAEQVENSVIITLEQNEQENVEAIIIYRVELDKEVQKIGTLKPNEISFTDKTIQKNKSYLYYTVVRSKENLSNPSNPLKIETK